ncbi:signal recognition particle, SRP9/SRP14 subunit [Rickenella mellea]|uniref:Signal recognition particle, SRP9/SRP14 subunit n=1 Tax=Rickenella mellea TaxID=50990 RepID=A0A4Y7QII4_9AGAM|nr:signal recognition particle, SRP9/SRP14 subunit [Rickenella mellea]
MVYIQSWQDYQEAAEALYSKSPNETRYCVKWKPGEAKLVLKITDNVTCLKFKTHSSIFLNRFESLNHTLMQKMQNRRPSPPQPARGPVPNTTTPHDEGLSRAGTPSGGGSSTVAAGSGAGGVKKKKAGGKKKK